MIADGVPEVAQARRLGHILGDCIQETYCPTSPPKSRRDCSTGSRIAGSKAIANSTTGESSWRASG